MVPSLKELAYRRIGVPSYIKSIKHLRTCPYALAEPFLRSVNHNQLLLLEENTPGLQTQTSPLWKLHTLKAFPSIVDTHEVDAEDIDWRLVFHDLQDERREREEAARAKLRQNYNQIADAKNGKRIQVTQLKAPTRQQVRASAVTGSRSTLGLPSRGAASIMGKAVKASLNSVTRSPKAAIPITKAVIRPNPNTRVGSPASVPTRLGNGSLPATNTKPRPSKFLLPTKKS